MVLTLAILLFLLAGTVLFNAQAAARRRAFRRFWTNLLTGILLLLGAVAASSFGLVHPDTFMPDPKSSCTYGLGAAAVTCSSGVSQLSGPSHRP